MSDVQNIFNELGLKFLMSKLIHTRRRNGKKKPGVPLNIYLTQLSFGVRIHCNYLPFKSLRVFDNKRLYLVNRR